MAQAGVNGKQAKQDLSHRSDAYETAAQYHYGAMQPVTSWGEAVIAHGRSDKGHVDPATTARGHIYEAAAQPAGTERVESVGRW